MPFRDALTIREAARGHAWRLNQRLRYKGRRDEFTVPANFLTDLGSVPWFVRWLIPTWGPGWTKAWVLHDYLCRFRLVSRRDADGIARRVLREEGHPALRWPAWVGLRIGARLGIGRPRGRPPAAA